MTVTAALMIAVYAIVNGNEVGWTTARTLGLLAVAAGLLVAFLVIESRVESPLVPLGLFRLRNVSTANAIGVFWAAAMFAWFFMSALYLQLVLGYSPLEVGLTFLPGNLIMGAFSIVLSAGSSCASASSRRSWRASGSRRSDSRSSRAHPWTATSSPMSCPA